MTLISLCGVSAWKLDFTLGSGYTMNQRDNHHCAFLVLDHEGKEQNLLALGSLELNPSSLWQEIIDDRRC
jgi:hypothetical protein